MALELKHTLLIYKLNRIIYLCLKAAFPYSKRVVLPRLRAAFPYFKKAAFPRLAAFSSALAIRAAFLFSPFGGRSFFI